MLFRSCPPALCTSDLFLASSQDPALATPFGGRSLIQAVEVSPPGPLDRTRDVASAMLGLKADAPRTTSALTSPHPPVTPLGASQAGSGAPSVGMASAVPGCSPGCGTHSGVSTEASQRREEAAARQEQGMACDPQDQRESRCTDAARAAVSPAPPSSVLAAPGRARRPQLRHPQHWGSTGLSLVAACAASAWTEGPSLTARGLRLPPPGALSSWPPTVHPGPYMSLSHLHTFPVTGARSGHR